ncbi:MAG: hypothetical protein P9L97_03540 [Candidatus Tenebribacter davisii]|nr:hypothetical protein [Candidatus Tenebribacter davisii]
MKLRRMKRLNDSRRISGFNYKKRNLEMLGYYKKVRSFKLTGDKFKLDITTVRNTLIKMKEFKALER